MHVELGLGVNTKLYSQFYCNSGSFHRVENFVSTMDVQRTDGQTDERTTKERILKEGAHGYDILLYEKFCVYSRC